MDVKDLLINIGFTQQECNTYHYYKSMVKNEIEYFSSQYMNGNILFDEVLIEIHKLCGDELHEYTLDLLFVAECMPYLLDMYEKRGIRKDIFFNTMSDLKCKLDECVRVKNIFGTFVVGWYKEFFKLERIAFGRLQYDIVAYENESVTINGYTIDTGDFILGCHIPSSGPLTPSLCKKSFEEAYLFFKDKLKDGILPIMCTSWLLYPNYCQVFGENSNTLNFQKNFKIVNVINTESFQDAWRVFGEDVGENADNLPSDTTLQRSFIEYIKKGYSFGFGSGFVLFDGTNILTRQ